ncbi:MAG TPA: hypothetical protein VLZ09_00410 [Gaiellaceae bacterium]|nr:hypothetical protein [Gaiellaceae bacterium]
MEPAKISVEFRHSPGEEAQGFGRVRIAELVYPTDPPVHVIEVEIELDDGSAVRGRLSWDAWVKGLGQLFTADVLPLLELVLNSSAVSTEQGAGAQHFAEGAILVAKTRGLTDDRVLETIRNFVASAYYIGGLHASGRLEVGGRRKR